MKILKALRNKGFRILDRRIIRRALFSARLLSDRRIAKTIDNQ